jgi:hypothetical protein
MLQMIQQLLPACAQPLLWSSAQAWQGCRLARNHCCGRQLKPGNSTYCAEITPACLLAAPVAINTHVA